MNSYRRHIGDYLKDTGHLTLLEHGVYSRLLDLYYLNDGPLTASESTIARKLGARTDDEKWAVNAVLEEFFTVREDGAFVHKRCEEVIAGFRKFGEQQRARVAKRYAKSTDGYPRLPAVDLPSTVGMPTAETPYPSGTSTVDLPYTNHKPKTINHIPPIPLECPPQGAASAVEAADLPKRAAQLPKDWKPKESHLAIASAEKKDIEREATKFKDYHVSKGSTFKDWDRAFNTWLRNHFNSSTSDNATKHRDDKRSREHHEELDVPDLF